MHRYRLAAFRQRRAFPGPYRLAHRHLRTQTHRRCHRLGPCHLGSDHHRCTVAAGAGCHRTERGSAWRDSVVLRSDGAGRSPKNAEFRFGAALSDRVLRAFRSIADRAERAALRALGLPWAAGDLQRHSGRPQLERPSRRFIGTGHRGLLRDAHSGQQWSGAGHAQYLLRPCSPALAARAGDGALCIASGRHRHRTHARRCQAQAVAAGRNRRARPSRACQPGQGRVSGHAQPRMAHAAQCHPGLVAADAVGNF